MRQRRKTIKKLTENTYLIGISVKCRVWQIFDENVEKQDLYRNKDDIRNFSKQLFIFKKYICKMYKLNERFLK